MTKFIFGQASWEQFGQNRVQYRTFDWNYFDSTHFRTFYYDQGKANARYAIKMAEQELQHIVYLMGGKLNKKLNIIIYNSFSDYRQTNLGRKNENINDANSGKVEIIGDNIPVYFDGDHIHLKQQIIKGISTVIKENMLFGDNLKEIVKNAVKMDLSEWYTAGYVSYISNEWTPEMQAEVENLIAKDSTKKLTEIANSNPPLIGHSFWRYIAKNYGENQLSNLLYLTRYRKSINASLQIVFKKPSKDIYNEWKNYYSPLDTTTTIYKDSTRSILARIPIKKDVEYSNISVSPSAKDIAFVEKKDGQFTIQLLNVKYNKINTIIEGGIRSSQELKDPDYPLITWSPSGRKVAILYVRKNQLNIRVYTTGERRMINKIISRSKIDRITGMCFMSDDNTLAITGIKKGASDLFTLTLKNARVENITKDLFDDKNPVVVQNGSFSGILFLSNRTSNYIGDDSKSDVFNDQFNLFLYQPSTGNNLIQLSNTKAEIKYPMQWGIENISYITNENNKLVRKIVKLEKRLTEHDSFSNKGSSPLLHNTLRQEYIHTSGNVIELTKEKNEYVVYSSIFMDRVKQDSIYLASQITDSTLTSNVKLDEQIPEYETVFENDSTSDILSNIFLDKQMNARKYEVYTDAVNKIKTYKYKTTFNPDFLQTTLDNTLLFTKYQVYNQGNRSYKNPSLAGFLTSTLIDIMEDYKLTAGARLGIDFNSNDYFLKYNNYRKRLDLEVLYYHHGDKTVTIDSSTPNILYKFEKNKMEVLQAKFSYPLSITKSIHFTTGIRYDRKVTSALEKRSLEIPSSNQLWSVSKLEYIFDNSFSPFRNIYKGSRSKIFAEYQYQISNGNKGFYNIGYDARKYSILYKNIILASRIGGAFSGGNAKILYKVGGVDNDLNPKQEANTVVDQTQNYAFQSKSTNLRGYKDGYLNGSSYLIINEEIRLPIYNTFFKRNIKSGFIKNLQLIAFADFGTAWKAFFPNSDNIVSQSIYSEDNGNVIVYVDNILGLGYGAGLRTKILGYYIRTDFAWNIKNTQKPLVHISLATDF